MRQPIRAVASHNRWGWLFGNGESGPFSASALIMPPSAFINQTWNSGRHAPGVTLSLTFGAPVTVLRLCPHMKPTEGFVGLIVVCEKGERVAHRSLWREGEWVAIPLSTPASEMRVEFMESPSWIALHAVEAGF
jgi:hypothetical protein